MGSISQYSTSLLPPPGPTSTLVRPTPSNPSPSSNPPLFTDAMRVRTTVFVDEQGCAAENEFDDDDARSWHWVIYREEYNEAGTEGEQRRTAIGTIRLVPPPHAEHAEGPEHAGDAEGAVYVKLGRVAVLPAYRGQGLGRLLVETAVEFAGAHADEMSRELVAEDGEQEEKKWDGLVLVHAQIQVEETYRRMGFVRDKGMGVWIEEGIEHVGMWRRADVSC